MQVTGGWTVKREESRAPAEGLADAVGGITEGKFLCRISGRAGAMEVY